jgi:hypothetical protein
MLPILFILLRSTLSTCNGDNEYVSINATYAHRCSDDKDFFQTGRYNITYCNYSEYMDINFCWWDTSYESHCLTSTECVWLEGVFDFGLCYCSESFDCKACDGKTPAPTHERTFVCPDQCNVYYLGCAGQYCNCGGDCSSAVNFECNNPVGQGCYTWRTTGLTEVPTTNPAQPPALQNEPLVFVLWTVRLCCLRETEIENTREVVAEICGVPKTRVNITSYTMVPKNNDTRRRGDAESWNIEYKVKPADQSVTSADDLISKLRGENSINAFLDLMNSTLGISLENVEIESVEEVIVPTDSPTDQKEAGGGPRGGISATILIAILSGVAVLLILSEFIRRMRRRSKGKKIGKGLSPTSTESTVEQDSVFLLKGKGKGKVLHDGSSDSIPEAALVVVSSESPEKSGISTGWPELNLDDATKTPSGKRNQSMTDGDELHGL